MPPARHLTARETRRVALLAIVALVAVVAARGDGWYHSWLARRLEAAETAGDYDAALGFRDRLDRSRAPDANSAFERGRLLRRNGDLLAAEGWFRKALALGHEPAAVARERLLARAQTGDMFDVEPAVTRLIREGGDDRFASECYAALAEGFLAAFRFADAGRCLDFWEQWRDDDPQLHALRGSLEERLGHPGAALASFRRGLQLAPGRVDLRRAVAHLELQAARLEDAAAEFRVVRAARPDDGAALLGIARCRLRVGENAEGERLIRQALALELAPQAAAEALAELAQLALEEGEGRRAVALAEEAVAVDPLSQRCHLVHAAGLASAGETTAAAAAQERARTLSEGRRRLSDTLMLLGKDPTNAELRADAGEILLESGFGSAGIRWLETAITMNPRHQRARKRLAEWHASVGDERGAAEHRRWIDAAGDGAAP
jgi:tetratricopeptide (TPR) repeat protein